MAEYPGIFADEIELWNFSEMVWNAASQREVDHQGGGVEVLATLLEYIERKTPHSVDKKILVGPLPQDYLVDPR